LSIGAIQSDVLTLIGGVAGIGTSGATGTDSGPAAFLDLSGDTSSNDYSANDYSQLSSTVLQSLALGNAVLNASAQLSAIAAASSRIDEAHSARLKSAQDDLANGDAAGARQIGQDLLKENGQDAAAAHIIARSYLAEGDYDSAAKYFARAASMAPGSERFQADLSNARLLQKPDDQVLQEARRLVSQSDTRMQGIRVLAYVASRSKGNTQAHLMLGDALMDEGYVVQAFASYQNALAVADENVLDQLVHRLKPLADATPDISVTHNLLGQALRKQGNASDALIELQKAADITPDNRNYLADVGLVYADMGADALRGGRAADALRYYERAVEMDSGSSELRGGLARAHAAMAQWWLTRGNTSKAYKELSSARFALPADQKEIGAEIARAFNNLGDRYEKDGDLGWTISCYQNAYNLDKGNTTYRTHLARALDGMGTKLYDQGKYESAEGYYQQAVDLFPGSDTYRNHLQNAKNLQ
jgi:tetratricopeptide (TPR) repeat protein